MATKTNILHFWCRFDKVQSDELILDKSEEGDLISDNDNIGLSHFKSVATPKVVEESQLELNLVTILVYPINDKDRSADIITRPSKTSRYNLPTR